MYATPADLLTRFHGPLIGDLASDTGDPLPPAEFGNDPRIVAALEDASGRIDAALLTGGKYTPEDLTNLTGHSLAHLKRLTCELAMVYLGQNRVIRWSPHLDQLQAHVEEVLRLLCTGVNVFAVPANIAAGNPSVANPTLAERENINSPTTRLKRYFPAEARFLPKP